MSRHQTARLVLILVIAVTVAVGLGKIGRAAWVEGSTPAVATMCVLLGLFAVAVVVWAASLPVDVDARPWAVLVREAETTTVMGAVGPVWPDGSRAALPPDLMTEPILFTHEPMFRVHDDERWIGGAITDTNDDTLTLRAVDGTEVTIGRHRGGIPVGELLQREGGQP